MVVSPDKECRCEINSVIHQAMQAEGKVSNEEHRVHVLYARQSISGADRQHAQNYRETNTLMVKRHGGKDLSYDPRRLQGATVYRDHERSFAQGERVQLTAPYHAEKLANRELRTVEQIDKGGNLKPKMDSGREVEFDAKQHPHLDYGYSVTSHSSQGQTADRVLIHVESAQAHGELLDSMAYELPTPHNDRRLSMRPLV